MTPKFAFCYRKCHIFAAETFKSNQMKTNKRFFRKTAAPLALVALAVVLSACPRSKPTYVDLGKIPEQYLATVPYKNGDVFRMQHESDRVVIDFTVSRHRQKEMEEGYGPVPTRFQPAPDWYYEYETDFTKCTPSYPIFDVTIQFSNQYMVYEEEQGYDPYPKLAQINGVGVARVPFFGEDCSDYEMADSLVINNRYYYDVFKLKVDGSYYEDKGPIHADTYYYNYEKGLLGIIMSNGEKYWLYED